MSKSPIYSGVIKEGKTAYSNIIEILRQEMPKPITKLVAKKIGVGKEAQGILTPLRVHDEAIGIFCMVSPALVEDFIPSVKNFAQCISTNLERIYEQAERKQTEKALRES